MQKEINLLKEKFKKIKDAGLCKSLRNGTTGIGFTFETLIGKKEDNLPEADFNGIEIKVKLGYSKSPTTLFSLTPKGYDYPTKHLLDRYGYPDNEIKEYKCFRGEAYYKRSYTTANRYIMKLNINHDLNRLELIISDINLNILDNNIYWDLDDIMNRIHKKLSYLAYIKGYPYKINDEIYYKYTSMNILRLKSFNTFLKLIEKDKIFICFNIGICKKGKNIGKIEDRGTAFKIKNEYINELFDLIE